MPEEARRAESPAEPITKRCSKLLWPEETRGGGVACSTIIGTLSVQRQSAPAIRPRRPPVSPGNRAAPRATAQSVESFGACAAAEIQASPHAENSVRAPAGERCPPVIG